MVKEKISKHDEMVESITPHVAYVKADTKIIGVYQTYEDMKFANNSKYVKKLKTKPYGYKIQMVIK